MNATELFPAAVRSFAGGPEVTWIGSNPFARGLCLGFDDGSIILSVDSTGYTTPPQEISPAKEAINGIAAIGTSSVAVSTRSDVTFINIEDNSRETYQGGAHGIVATRSGYFIAPLGPMGILVAKPERESRLNMHVTSGTEGQLYFYRAAALHDSAGKEVLVFANRRNGLGVTEFNGDQIQAHFHTMSFKGLDVVDVCGVAPGSLSAIAISPNAEVLWISDASKKDDPTATKLTGIEGHVYRVLATPEHLLVLSSKALYVWTGLVSKMFSRAKLNWKSPPLALPLAAVDMSLHENTYVLLVMAANAIMSLKITDLAEQTIDPTARGGVPAPSMEMARKTEVENFAPDWQRHDLEQGTLAAV